MDSRFENEPTLIDSFEEEDEEAINGREIWPDNEQEDHHHRLLDHVNHRQRHHRHDDHTSSSVFYSDFPPLPDFPCMSPSSSSSSTPAPLGAITCSSSTSSASSSSTAASWAVLKSDAEEDKEKRNINNHNHDPSVMDHASQSCVTLSSTASMEIPRLPDDHVLDGDCMDMMETFGYMDLMESNDFFDPSCIFQNDQQNLLDGLIPELVPEQENGQNCGKYSLPNNQQDVSMGQVQGQNIKMIQEEERDEEDMGKVFLEWLRTNGETVSADDLRSVKIKKATVEAAARRLGGGKDAMKQLLKLVLQWVQTNHLQKRRFKELSSDPSSLAYQLQQDFFQSSSPNPNNLNSINSITHESNNNNPCTFAPAPWIQPSPYANDQTMVPAYPSPMGGFMGTDPFCNGITNMNTNPFPPQTDRYHMLESSQSWTPQFALACQFNSFLENNFPPPLTPQPQGFTAGYGNQYGPTAPHNQFNFHGQQGGSDHRLLRLGSSATKEARKKRMARQRRFSSHHKHHHHGHHNNTNQPNSQLQDQSNDHLHARLGDDPNCTAATVGAQANPGNWVYWPPSTNLGGGASSSGFPIEELMVNPGDRASMQGQNYQGRVNAPDPRRQGWKPEKNLRFLLQKVLKQSDVGNLGRIVLPKKEAETHLPELKARDGISIAMEDIGTSRVWNMRYRYWPNNKSRMYLLENTGDFVRANGLQEGDFIVIYSDVKCSKYMIRGVKVRQVGPKSETSKRPTKSQRNQQNATPDNAAIGCSSLQTITPTPKTVK